MQHDIRSDRGEDGLAHEDQRRIRRGGVPLPPDEKRVGERGGENRRDDHSELHLKRESDEERLPPRHI